MKKTNKRKPKVKRKPRHVWDPCRIGTIGEMYTALNLLERGYEPYMPLPGRVAKYDMLAHDIETGIIYPVSVKTSASPNAHSTNGDGAARHDGGIVARIRYELPVGAVRTKLARQTLDIENLPLAHVPWKEAKLAKRNTDEIMDFIKDLDLGTVLPTSIFMGISDVPIRTVNRALFLAVQDGILRRVKWGHYERVTPPGDKDKLL
jgi:hypothetical protein